MHECISGSVDAWMKAQEDMQSSNQSSSTSCSDSESESSSSSTTDDPKKQGANQDPCGAEPRTSSGASHSQTAKPKEDEGHQHDVPDNDSDSLSEASETVDANSVEVDATMEGTTREDEEIAHRNVFKNKLRAHPLMPWDPQDPSQLFLDMDSGIRLPLVHCAFSGCTWTADYGSHYLSATLGALGGRVSHFYAHHGMPPG